MRFVQLYHQGWDQHGQLPREMPLQAEDVDRASAALIKDLKTERFIERNTRDLGRRIW